MNQRPKENSSSAFVIPLTDIKVIKQNIINGLQIPPEQVDAYLDNLVNDLLVTSLDLAKPMGDYIIIDNPEFVDGDKMVLQNEEFTIEKMIYAALKKSTSIALFVCTAGAAIESWSKELHKNKLTLESLIVDLIGSEIAEEAAKWMHQKIETIVQTSQLNITNRYSPGYCNWNVADQQKLFILLSTHTCGVKLTKSSLMLPIKSVSGIIGLGKQVQQKPYACSKCDEGFCIYRDKRK